MEKRILLAVTLSFLVLFLYQNLVVKPPPATTPTARRTPPPAVPTKPDAQTGQPAAVSGQGADSVQPPTGSGSPLEAAPAVADDAARDIVVETSSVRAVFSSRGAELKSWQLKHFADAAGKPLDLIPADLPGATPRPFALSFEDAAVTQALRQALFKPNTDGLHVTDQAAALVFDYDDGAGLVARKMFEFVPATPYVVRFQASVTKDDQPLNPAVEWGPGPGGAADESSMYVQKPEGIFGQGGSAERLNASSIQEQPQREGPFAFVGIDNHYFLAAAVLRNAPARVNYQVVTLPASSAGQPQRELVAYTLRFASAPSTLNFYCGPKEFDLLAAVDRELVRAINFGWFAPLVTPLLRALKWINGYVSNYGWSIIILTILINLAMFPLRHKSVVSMRKMQELQPEVKAIQDRYAKLKATDPARQKMNVELMNLYRERGVNPASGCLPMLLTMPVLFAFYSLLSQAIEIRGAPFVLWIKDLSAHDPLYVTPVLMGLTMVWQQKMTPTTADPTQQKIMMFMPIMFTFMFLWAPSGLVLYWLVSNLWGIGQQQVTNRIIGPPVVRTVRPPAERKLKPVGAGKSERASERA